MKPMQVPALLLIAGLVGQAPAADDGSGALSTKPTAGQGTSDSTVRAQRSPLTASSGETSQGGGSSPLDGAEESDCE